MSVAVAVGVGTEPSVTDQLAQLEAAKAAASAREDFERAAELRDEIAKLKAEQATAAIATVAGDTPYAAGVRKHPEQNEGSLVIAEQAPPPFVQPTFVAGAPRRTANFNLRIDDGLVQTDVKRHDAGAGLQQLVEDARDESHSAGKVSILREFFLTGNTSIQSPDIDGLGPSKSDMPTQVFHRPTGDHDDFIQVKHQAIVQSGRKLMYVGLRASNTKGEVSRDMVSEEHAARVAAEATKEEAEKGTGKSIPSPTGWADRASMKCGWAGKGSCFAEYCVYETLQQAKAACEASGQVFRERLDIYCVRGSNVDTGASDIEKYYTEDGSMQPILAGSDPLAGMIVYSTQEGLGTTRGDVCLVYCGPAFGDLLVKVMAEVRLLVAKLAEDGLPAPWKNVMLATKLIEQGEELEKVNKELKVYKALDKQSVRQSQAEELTMMKLLHFSTVGVLAEVNKELVEANTRADENAAGLRTNYNCWTEANTEIAKLRADLATEKKTNADLVAGAQEGARKRRSA